MKINEIFAKCEKITMSKRQDYTNNPEIDAHENFKRASMLAEWFDYTGDVSYIVLIGTKLARLSSLLNNDKKPNNESIEDTFIDLINYCALWAERRLSEDDKRSDTLNVKDVEPARVCGFCKKDQINAMYYFDGKDFCSEGCLNNYKLNIKLNQKRQEDAGE